MNTPISFELDKLLLEKDIPMPVNPTISDVVMWLYEKHGIWVHSEICFDGKGFIPKITEVVENQYPYNTQFNSPTEAYEAAIEYTLNNLI